MKQEQITLRCEDWQEAVVFTKYNFNGTVQGLTNGHSNYKDSFEISIEDDYIGGDYKGFFGRIKRAWRAFWDKPVVYTSIYCEDKDKMKKFLYDCLDLISKDCTRKISCDRLISLGEYQIVYSKPYITESELAKELQRPYYTYKEDDSVTSNEELIKNGEW